MFPDPYLFLKIVFYFILVFGFLGSLHVLVPCLSSKPAAAWDPWKGRTCETGGKELFEEVVCLSVTGRG